MFVIFEGVDARVFLLFVFFTALAEGFVQLRWRIHLRCPHCGFDPVQYQQSPERAASLVKEHLARRRDDPRSALLRPLRLPFRKVKSEEPMPLRGRKSGPVALSEARNIVENPS